MGPGPGAPNCLNCSLLDMDLFAEQTLLSLVLALLAGPQPMLLNIWAGPPCCENSSHKAHCGFGILLTCMHLHF